MSKGLTVIAAEAAVLAAAPYIITAAGIAAAGIGAAWLTKKAWEKGKELVAKIPPEHQRYLFPFGADGERLKLAAATVVEEPFAGISFGETLPAFAVSSTDSFGLPSVRGREEGGSFSPTQEGTLEYVAGAAQAVGFRTERRALPPGASVLVFDLAQLASARGFVPIPMSKREA